MKLTQKQETFCLKYFELGNASEAAIVAGYSPKYAATNTTKLLNNTKISAYLDELNQKVEDKSIATVAERKQRLTELLREDLLSSKGSLIRTGNIMATQELNRMERVYEEGVKIDNRTISIHVNSEKAKELTQKLIEGERTE